VGAAGIRVVRTIGFGRDSHRRTRYRAIGCAGQDLFALSRRYLINDKGAPAETAGFPRTIARLTDRMAGIWSAIGERRPAVAPLELPAIRRELKDLAREAA
jgi:hypothetical protein